ncbi:Methyltransferase_domain-containing protein [Hexamita inflata]|uniref:Methyltransferase domain-containing protein n=1 Tax=Hexamita inflata TaxID=28002 RepID=A0AA86R637_9EUKA|nr:Methyltransferase domain-containing protein [Hexamita inflata]
MKSLEEYIRRYYYLYKLCDYDLYFQDTNWLVDVNENSLLQIKQLSVCDNSDISHYFSKSDDLCSESDLISDTTKVQIPSDCNIVSDQQFQSMNARKSSQIELLSTLISENIDLNTSTQIVDLGGGVGHLANLLQQKTNLKTIVLERDQQFTSKGQNLYKNLSFITKTITDESSFDQLFPPSVICGLHTCGSFGVHLIQMFIRSSAQFNLMVQVPCCYQTISIENFLVSKRFSDLKAFLVQKQINFRSFLNLCCCDQTKNLSLSTEEIQVINKAKHRRMIYEKVNKILTDEIGQQMIAKRSRIQSDDMEGYFKQQFETLIGKEFKLKKNMNEYLIEAYGTSNIAEINKEFAFEKYEPMLIKIFKMQTVVCRTFEKLIIADRICMLEEAGYQVKTQILCSAADSPRNIVLVIKK